MRQGFTEATPLRPVEFVNLRARFGTGDFGPPVRVLIGSHYDTKIFPSIRFVGANDGGSSSGALLEMARVLALRPGLAKSVELVFFDGEEAVQDYTATDGLYGSRYYAREITRRQRPSSRPQAVVILDMIGDPDLKVQIPSDTPRQLAEGLFAAAKEAGTSAHFGWMATPITDDHAPFQREGVPAIDLIDLDFAPWHTSRDTMEQVNADSLEIVGRTALLFVERHLPAP
ncbi:MAG: Zn-dependent amino- or carboxypeptidase, M28 family [Verrucomicrobia bacterium]|nr:MAG: Zn-dependent amino- or carboxypeptidase, M28 family [Verrucomicrobiota bacterium]